MICDVNNANCAWHSFAVDSESRFNFFQNASVQRLWQKGSAHEALLQVHFALLRSCMPAARLARAPGAVRRDASNYFS